MWFLSCNFYWGFMLIFKGVCVGLWEVSGYVCVSVQARMCGLFQWFLLFHSFRGLLGL